MLTIKINILLQCTQKKTRTNSKSIHIYIFYLNFHVDFFFLQSKKRKKNYNSPKKESRICDKKKIQSIFFGS